MKAPLAPLLRHCGAQRWALDVALACLEPVDVARLAIAALEHGGDAFRELTHLLLDGEAPCAKLDADGCLNDAVALDCWRAAEHLSLRVERTSRRWGLPSLVDASADADAVGQAPPDSALRRVMVACARSRFVFQRGTFTAVGARGDVSAAHCLLLHELAVSPRSFHSARRDAYRAAVDARQLQVADWLATHSYCPADCKDPLCQLPARTLVDQLASHGDLESLQRLHARGGHATWNTSTATAGAAENGHVAVVEWLLGTTGRSLDPTLFERAAKHRQLAMLEWVWTRRDMRDTWVNYLQPAARHGRLDVLRWLKRNLDEATWKRHQPTALLAAGQASQLEVVRFFHEACGLRLDASFLKTMTEATTAEFVEYVLDRTLSSEVNGAELVHTAACDSTLDVVKYLVLRRGYWNRNAFAGAVSRRKRYQFVSGPPHSSGGLEISRFLYAHAHERAFKFYTSLEEQVDVRIISILTTAWSGEFGTARWLAESVPEVDTGDVLSAWMTYSDKKFPHSAAAQSVITTCLRARPAQCHKVNWLPLWAVRASCFEAFAMLVDIAHPLVASTPVFSAILHDQRDSRFLAKLLEADVLTAHARAGALSWAAGVGSIALLNTIQSRWGDALHALTPSERLEMALSAVQHGHVDVLQWLHDRALLLPPQEHGPAAHDTKQCATLVQLVQETVNHDRVECLRWIVDALAVSDSILVVTLRADAPACSAFAHQRLSRDSAFLGL